MKASNNETRINNLNKKLRDYVEVDAYENGQKVGSKLVVDVNKGRLILCSKVSEVPYVQILASILKKFGDVEGVNSGAVLEVQGEYLEVSVKSSSDLKYQGILNHSQGVMTKRCADLALTTFLNNHIIHVLFLNGVHNEALNERHYRLMEQAKSELDDAEYAQYRAFLD